MSHLSPKSRAILAAAQRDERLSPEDKARLRAALGRRMAAGMAAGSALLGAQVAAGGTSKAASVGHLAWMATASKIVGGVALVGASITAIVHNSRPTLQVTHGDMAAAVQSATTRLGPSTTAPQPAASQPAPPYALTPAFGATQSRATGDKLVGLARNGASAQTGVHDTATTMRHVEDPKTPPAGASHTEESPTRPAPIAPAQSTQDGLLGEIATLRSAQAALRHGNPQSALDQIAQSVPAGVRRVLEQEFLVTQILALCDLGRSAEAQRLAQTFFVRFEHSPLATRVRASCALPSHPSSQ